MGHHLSGEVSARQFVGRVAEIVAGGRDAAYFTDADVGFFGSAQGQGLVRISGKDDFPDAPAERQPARFPR